MDFDATSLYPSAMWDKNRVYPKIETGYAFKPQMNDVFVSDFNNKTFNQDGNDSALSKKNITIHQSLHLNTCRLKKVENIEVNRMRNGYIIDTLTSFDICEVAKVGGKVIEIYEGVIYRENFKISPFRKVIEKFLL